MKHNLKGCFLHKNDHWSTPKEIYEDYMNKGFIDPCPLHSKEDCLIKDYYNKKLFINPPYSNLKIFIKWIINQIRNGCKIDLLVPARTDTKWFHEIFPFIQSIDFIEGRLHFNESKSAAPFPSIIIHLKRYKNKLYK